MRGIQMNNEGMHLHRLPSNPLEKAYHDAWIQHNKFSDTLQYLLSEDNKPVFVEDRDRLVAATVIQWLGSPVGQGFVDNVLKGEYK